MKRRTRWLAWGWLLGLGGCLAGKLEPPLPFVPRPKQKISREAVPTPTGPRFGRELPDDHRQRFHFLTFSGPPAAKAAPGMILSQLVFKGAALGDLTYHLDSAALTADDPLPGPAPFEQISLTRPLHLASGPAIEDRRGETFFSAGPVPRLVTVPEPSINALGLAAALVLGLRRRRL